MFDEDFDDEENQHTSVTLRYETRGPFGNNYIQRTKEVGESYDDILDEMVWFLQSCGFTYIHGLTALGEGSEELKTTSTL